MVDRNDFQTALGLFFILMCVASGGCHSDASSRGVRPLADMDSLSQLRSASVHDVDFSSDQVNQQAPANSDEPVATQISRIQFVETVAEVLEPDDRLPEPSGGNDELAEIVSQAIAIHPEIRRLRANTREAWARVPQVRALPDPMAQGTVFGEPMMMADGESRGTFMISQSIPYLKRLDARAQQASFEALMNQQAVRAAELRIAADVREAWYRLYLLEKLLQINDSNEQLIESLVTIASAQVEVGRATAGDVIQGTLELSRVEEERLKLDQQLASRKAIFNQLLNRPADSAIETPSRIDNLSAELSLDILHRIALEQQPEITLARLRTQATEWGIRVAKLERVPDLTLSYEHMFMRMNPGSHGSDPWQLGAGINIPLWHQKYDAIRQEAAQKHFAAHSETEEMIRANEAMLLDFIEQARAADRTAGLYQQTILPQIRQVLDADQRAYGQGAVQFERVIANARNLLIAQSAYHRALTDKAIALARLEQTVGTPLPLVTPENIPAVPGQFPSSD